MSSNLSSLVGVELVGDNFSRLPMLVTDNTKDLLATRTTYCQRDSHSWAVGHLISNAFRIVRDLDIELESLVIGKNMCWINLFLHSETRFS